MLTPKDVLYATDISDQMLVLNKRIAQDTTNIQKKEVTSCFDDVITTLKSNYKDVVTILEKEAK